MAIGATSFRSRAASLIPFPTPFKGTNQEKGSGNASNTPTESPLREKAKAEEGQNFLEESQNFCPSGKTYRFSGGNAVASDRVAQRIVRTIPSEFSARLSLQMFNCQL